MCTNIQNTVRLLPRDDASVLLSAQLEGAVEGKNGFQPNDVLRLTAAAAPNSDVPAPLTHSVPAEAAAPAASEGMPAGPPSGSNVTRQNADLA